MEPLIKEFIDANFMFVNDNQKNKFFDDFMERFNSVAIKYDLRDNTDNIYPEVVKQALMDTYLQVPNKNGRRKNGVAVYPNLKEKGIFKQNGLYIKERYDFPDKEVVVDEENTFVFDGSPDEEARLEAFLIKQAEKQNKK